MRTLDDIARDTLGNQVLEIINLTAKIEALEEQLKKASSGPNPEPV